MDNNDLVKMKIEMERDYKIKSIEMWGDLAKSSATEKYSTLTTVSSLAAALLVIATFNEKLVPLTNYTRWIIVCLLFLIPISIWSLLTNLYRVEKKAREELEKIIESTIKHEKPTDAFIDKIPYIITSILTILVFLIIKLILD